MAPDISTGNCQVPNIVQSRIKHLHDFVSGGDDINLGEEISVGCNPGYIRSGEKYIRCLTNGSWSHAVPECRSSFRTVAPPSKYSTIYM
jgi:hypothetical protein